MWKFIARGVRESLEHRTSCRTNVYTQSSQDGNNRTGEVKCSLVPQQNFLAPNFFTFNKRGFGSTKDGGTRDERYDSKWNAKHSWSEAVGWSSVVAVGWVVCQSLCLRKNIWERDINEFWQKPIPKFHVKLHISHLLNPIWNLQPKQVFSVTNCDGSKYDTEEENNTTSDESSIPQNFGPITIEEALAQARKEFELQQHFALAEYELQHGVEAIQEKRYKDALRHFTSGANLSSSRSMFNLGICYEKGLGTLVDTVQAAKYYKKAADRGHPDAMYNLGVYHAQGKGGLSVDLNMARLLFQKAAKLGHSSAQRALDLENKFSNGKTRHVKQNDSNIRLQKADCYLLKKISNSDNSHSNYNSIDVYGQIIKYEDTVSSDLKNKSYSESSNTMNATDMFLEYLGVHTKSTLSIPLGINMDKV